MLRNLKGHHDRGGETEGDVDRGREEEEKRERLRKRSLEKSKCQTGFQLLARAS